MNYHIVAEYSSNEIKTFCKRHLKLTNSSNLVSARTANIPIESVCRQCLLNFNKFWNKDQSLAPKIREYRPSLAEKWFPIFYQALVQRNVTAACLMYSISPPAYYNARSRHRDEYEKAEILACKKPGTTK